MLVFEIDIQSFFRCLCALTSKCQTGKHTDRHASGQSKRQTERQTETDKDWSIYTLVKATQVRCNVFFNCMRLHCSTYLIMKAARVYLYVKQMLHELREAHREKFPNNVRFMCLIPSLSRLLTTGRSWRGWYSVHSSIILPFMFLVASQLRT